MRRILRVGRGRGGRKRGREGDRGVDGEERMRGKEGEWRGRDGHD